MTDMRAGFGQQLSALLRRNLILKKRNKNQTFQEIFYPIFFILVLGLIRSLLSPEQLPGIPNIPAYELTRPAFSSFLGKTLVAYPNTSDVKEILEDVAKILSGNPSVVLFNNRSDMVRMYRDNSSIIAAGIEFMFLNTSVSGVQYTIREPYEMMPGPQPFTNQGFCRNHSGLDRSNCPANAYLYTGFAVLQAALDAAIIRFKSGKMFTPPNLLVQMLPKLAFTPSIITIQILSSIYFVIAYSPFVNFLTVNLVAEKESKIREMMKIMGLRDSVYWASWGLVYLVIMIIVTSACVVIAHFMNFFTNSNLFLFFLILLLYGMTVINFGFMMTPFFKKAQTAGAVASLSTSLFSLLYLPVGLTRTIGPTGLPSSTIPVAGQWLMCLLSPVALALCIDQAVFLDIANKGMNFNTLALGEFPLYAPLLMLFVDFLLYGILAIYLDNVIPGEYGPRQPPWYCLTSSYWFAGNKRKHHELAKLVGNKSSLSDQNYNIESVPQEMEEKDSLRIFNIKKIFKKDKEDVIAINDLSLDMYEGQITCLLGHNGAGKTTLINMLTGMIQPTRGTATIHGYDLSDPNEMAMIRNFTGVCPQANCLFDDLTCHEHLNVYAGIKGIPSADVDQEVMKALKDVDLGDKMHTLARNLSGGQKRKLSVAIALMGDPKVVFLDEPSAGMDPYSRRQLWTLLKSKRPGRVILLTTHFMDEADILADRKAFIKDGRLQCCGSSLFLKHRFGIGYHLGMVLSPEADVPAITELVKKHIPDVKESRSHGQEVSYTLPMEDVSLFPALFSQLETPADDGKPASCGLGIDSYGVSMTTLEEVFLKLEGQTGDFINVEEGQKGDFINVVEDVGDDGSLKQPKDSVNGGDGSFPRLRNAQFGKCNNLRSQRFWAVCKIRALLFLRNKMAILFRVLFPVALIITGAAVNKSIKPSDASNPSPVPLLPQYYAKMSAGPVLNVPPMIYEVASGAPGDVKQFLTALYYQGLSPQQINASTNLSLFIPHNLGVKIHNVSDTGKVFESKFTALYNDSAVYSLPVIISIINNALYKMRSGDPSAFINATSLPWPAIHPELKLNQAVFSSVILIGVALAVLPAGFAADVVRDRQEKARSQLRISGITWSMYWLTTFFPDILMFSFSAVLSIVVLFIFQVESIMYGGACISILILYILYMPLMTLIAFLLSFAFKSFETALTVMPNIFLFTSFLPYMAVATVEMTDEATGQLLHLIFTVTNPTYAVYGGLYYVDKIYRVARLTQENPIIPFGEYFKWKNHVLITLIMPAVHLVWVTILLMIVDIYSTGGKISAVLPCAKDEPSDLQNDDIPRDEDEDVTAERERLLNLHPLTDLEVPVVAVSHLRKEFKKNVKGGGCFTKKQNINTAVRNMTFGVQCGEVFGLLGPNGAGKTTTLNMIIAEEGITRGKVAVNGHDIHSSMSEAFQALGYCPQHDPLWPEITMAEHISCYAAIRGIPKHSIKPMTDHFLQSLEIMEHKNKRARELSGGTKRKLSYILSMLGDPKVVLLDEPSTGMDPKSKRFLWDTINSTFKGSERGAILTTHYMEEADALCSRVSIMVNGQMKCIGSTQHLKLKFSSGYVLEVKLSEKDAVRLELMKEVLHKFVLEHFRHATLAEMFGDRVTYKIPNEDMKSLAQSFTILEQEGKRQIGIEDYTLSHSTLEQVFLEFARHQLDEGETENVTLTTTTA